jgi:CubicO group peptidase (beta-lactamase class C family)
MTPMRRRLLLVILLLTCAATSAAELPKAKIETIDRLVKAYMTTNGVPGLSIAVVADGRLQWSSGYGLADAENAVKAADTTMYRVASMGKTMTAIAAMQLVEEGKLDLEGDIRDNCPAFPAKQWRITPRNLLNHTSGIRHYGGPHDQEEQFSTIHYPNVTAALAPFKDDPLQFEPGTRFLYSTYGFDVLGCVVEGAAKMPLLAYMREHVWLPAGMTSTRDDDPAAIVPNRAAKYTRAGGHLRNAPAIDMSNRLPAGGYLTSAHDMGRYLEALLNGRLVKPATFAAMITPATLNDGKVIATGYGLGWGVELEEWHEDRYAFHGGSSPGASGFLSVMAKHRFGVVFLTNVDDLPGRSDLAEDVARVVLDYPPRKP